VRVQLEGAVIMGISNALYSNISIKQGRIDQSNFGDYLVARTDITPETHVHIVESSAPPGGVAEPGVPPVQKQTFRGDRTRIKRRSKADGW
jgi:isoquinoline 1-oxidoreductase beta subunit